MSKTCTKCEETFDVSFFNRDRTKVDGLHSHCKNCTRAASNRAFQKYHDKHLAMKQRWKDENRERHREINRTRVRENPQFGRDGARRYRERLLRATPPWVDRKEIALIRSLCPPGWHVDHIHPLAGKKSCGLNVPWNLQFLPPEVHYKKGVKEPVEQEAYSHL